MLQGEDSRHDLTWIWLCSRNLLARKELGHVGCIRLTCLIHFIVKGLFTQHKSGNEVEKDKKNKQNRKMQKHQRKFLPPFPFSFGVNWP